MHLRNIFFKQIANEHNALMRHFTKISLRYLDYDDHKVYFSGSGFYDHIDPESCWYVQFVFLQEEILYDQRDIVTAKKIKTIKNGR